MFCGWFAASGIWCLESVPGTMKSQDYQGTLKRKVSQTSKDPKNTAEALKSGKEQGIGLF